MTYQDEWGRWHDKPCIDGKPSSNNGWVYTAYAGKLGYQINMGQMRDCARQCLIKVHCEDRWVFTRSPGKQTPPMSRDEILGLVYLGVLGFKEDNWNFCPYNIPKFNLFKTLGALWRMRKAHRNTLWEGKGEPHLFRFAFSVPLQDRAFILRCQKMDVPWYYGLISWVDSKLKGSSPSSELIRQLKYETSLDNETVIRYFGPQHPFSL